jgi:hypothetical protein
MVRWLLGVSIAVINLHSLIYTLGLNTMVYAAHGFDINAAVSIGEAVEPRIPYSNRTYRLKSVDLSSCSYMAGWLANINLYRKIAFYADICRAEAASNEMLVSHS